MRFRLVTIFLLLAAPLSGAQEALPYHGEGDLPPTQDQILEQQLKRDVCAAGYCDLVNDDKLSMALVLMPTEGPTRLAMLNGHNMAYAASLPKVAILLGAMVASERGQLTLSDPVMDDLDKMIRVSCNDCATRSLTLVGRENLLAILREPGFAFYDDKRAGGLWVGKDYAAGKAYQRDPIKGLSHAATPYQVARLYYRLNNGSLLDNTHSEIMKDMLDDPGIQHKFVRGLEDNGVTIEMRKSGSWEDFHSDSVLVHHAGGHYIGVAIVEHPDGEVFTQTLADIFDALARGRAVP
ncbi:MAG: serine hydrolase [Halieaceae bacterium]